MNSAIQFLQDWHLLTCNISFKNGSFWNCAKSEVQCHVALRVHVNELCLKIFFTMVHITLII